MPIFTVLVRAAMALATIIGADITERSGAPCNSASHTASRPYRSAASTSASAWSNAADSPLSATGGNSMKLPNSIAKYLRGVFFHHHDLDAERQAASRPGSQPASALRHFRLDRQTGTE